MWRSAGRAGRPAHKTWSDRLKSAPAAHRLEFSAECAATLRAGAGLSHTWSNRVRCGAKSPATRNASESVLEALTSAIPEMIGGSADLTGSNNTRPKGLHIVSRRLRRPLYPLWRAEHAMAGAMNGLALHGGIIPYSGTFLVFTDYCRPAIRLSALMGQRVIHVMTHDSIGLGEDGPTHQPIEHLAPCAPCPTCWSSGLAIGSKRRNAGSLRWRTAIPRILALTRQACRTAPRHDEDNLCAAGGYQLARPKGKPKVSLFASGSEVSIAVEARNLRSRGIDAAWFRCRVSSCFTAPPAAARRKIIGTAEIRVAVEAAVRQGWDEISAPMAGLSA